jgi:hypothetical protein
MSALGDLIRQARKHVRANRERLTQGDLGTKVDRTKQWVCSVERGSRLPTFEQLVKLYKVLAAAQEQKYATSLGIWLLTWLNEQVGKMADNELGASEKRALQADIETVVAQVSRPAMTRKPGMPWSLKDWPSAFDPLTIVCGTRRHVPPETLADLFAFSPSIADLMFLPQLERRTHSTMIIYDSLFMLMDDEYLKWKFGKTNLLVIGALGVNLLARRINNRSVFRFDLDPNLKTWVEKWWGEKLRSAPQLKDQQAVEVFWQMVQQRNDPASFLHRNESDLSPDELKELADLAEQLIGHESLDDLMTHFREPNLVDPADGKVHNATPKPTKDFAIISLTKHPFTENPDSMDYVCIMVAGIHGRGTTHALKALAEADFSDHPFGGIIALEENPRQDYTTRFERARWKWLTAKYTPDQVLTNLQNALQQGSAEQRVFRNLTHQEIEEYIKLVRSLMGAPNSTAQP